MQVTFPSNISKYEALISLWKGTKTLGMGAMHSHIEPTINDAQKHFIPDEDEPDVENNYVDYFFGRPIKVDFCNYPNLNSAGYDRDAGSNRMKEIADNTSQVYYPPTKTLNNEEILKFVDDNPILVRTYTSLKDDPSRSMEHNG